MLLLVVDVHRDFETEADVAVFRSLPVHFTSSNWFILRVKTLLPLIVQVLCQNPNKFDIFKKEFIYQCVINTQCDMINSVVVGMVHKNWL